MKAKEKGGPSGGSGSGGVAVAVEAAVEVAAVTITVAGTRFHAMIAWGGIPTTTAANRATRLESAVRRRSRPKTMSHHYSCWKRGGSRTPQIDPHHH
jgi:hypothetical protein